MTPEYGYLPVESFFIFCNLVFILSNGNERNDVTTPAPTEAL